MKIKDQILNDLESLIQNNGRFGLIIGARTGRDDIEDFIKKWRNKK